MNGLGKNLKRRLLFKGLCCCGATWSPRTTIRTIIEEEEEEKEEEEEEEMPIIRREQPSDLIPARNGNNPAMINLRMALAAERNLRRSNSNVGLMENAGPVKTLMRLIEETDGVDWRKKNMRENSDEEEGKEFNDWVCCVCMERNKGAAFIPCGHTFCRVCSREMWANRGSCPLCSRSILDILDIF